MAALYRTVSGLWGCRQSLSGRLVMFVLCGASRDYFFIPMRRLSQRYACIFVPIVLSVLSDMVHGSDRELFCSRKFTLSSFETVVPQLCVLRC